MAYVSPNFKTKKALKEAVAERGIDDVARILHGHNERRRVAVQEAEHALTVSRSRELFTTRDVVDDSRHLVLLRRLPRRFTVDRIVHRFLGQTEPSHDLANVDRALNVPLSAGTGECAVFRDEHR